MKITTTPLNDCLLLEPKIYKDDRGLFLESFNHKAFTQALGYEVNFVQDNLSVSVKGTLRGLHFQKGSDSQAKLVQVLKGKVQDVVVDLRPGSSTYGNTFSIVLDDIERKQLFIPKGFAHGFLALSDEVLFSYKCDGFYAPGSESGIIYNDPDLNVEWQLPAEELVLSDKDRILKGFDALESEQAFQW
ncbi:dTDP-4-dehydrorhamnose 3,5-epimerase [Robertkochia sediminum]|uniref:dTDP-4-dehydrorhamnose 3,5-epimerase n=1 Tax=Robertkochia sediminum TaxID=2785326 RepID=UPI001933848A|nr:dTDP-4-dehydrorhamnose 3,5-epimerase [Robertkochia sediminum]MBL7471753.1 dTDP-4-dehydrorhamnose 3,5-epimerase [Robertkochia sediminum]